jgi:hypothetical protein
MPAQIQFVLFVCSAAHLENSVDAIKVIACFTKEALSASLPFNYFFRPRPLP